MIDALVFSKDRPMQLDACLRSLRHTSSFVEKPFVLWSGEPLGYSHLAHAANFYGETDDFARGVRYLLELCGPYVLMLCDDALTYREFPADPLDAMADDVLCFSFRLGRNTTYCHPRDLQHGLPEFEERGPFLVWNWLAAHPDGDFGYPYSTDGVIHRRTSLLQWLDGAEFVNPNTMEDAIVKAIGRRNDLPPLMACYPHSVQVGLPLNVVTETHRNRHGLTHPYTTDELNKRFLRGERIDYERMDFSNIIGAHQELPLVFK